jgi:RNA polymerase sigma factor (sigma-70 family)
LCGKKREGPVVYSEEQIIEMARDGDVQAFTWIVERYKGFLLAAVIPIVGGEDAAEDVLQEAFLQIYRSLSRYSGGSFRSWVARIAVNKAIDCHRGMRRLLPSDGESSSIGAHPSAEEQALAGMGLSRVASAVAGLSPAYRRTFLQHYVYGASCREMASMEGVSAKTIESRLFRARQILREKLREPGARDRR